MLELHTERPLSETEDANVLCFFVRDEEIALNRNIHQPSGGSNLNVKNECTAIACTEREGMWNVLLEL
jgi:hypothetical protein